jgi:hypothetical protein
MTEAEKGLYAGEISTKKWVQLPSPAPIALTRNCRNLLIIRSCYTISVIPMGMEETVCAKVPAGLKKKLSSLGVNVSEVIRESLQSEVDRLEKEKLNKLAKEVSAIFKKIPPEEFAQSVRASRDSR